MIKHGSLWLNTFFLLLAHYKRVEPLVTCYIRSSFTTGCQFRPWLWSQYVKLCTGLYSSGKRSKEFPLWWFTAQFMPEIIVNGRRNLSSGHAWTSLRCSLFMLRMISKNKMQRPFRKRRSLSLIQIPSYTYTVEITQEVERLRECMEHSQDIQRHAHGRSDGQGAYSKYVPIIFSHSGNSVYSRLQTENLYLFLCKKMDKQQTSVSMMSKH